jgi:hypothetical protein
MEFIGMIVTIRETITTGSQKTQIERRRLRIEKQKR